MERCLKCETIHDPELLEQNDPSRLNLALLNPKLTAIESEHLGLVVEDLGEHLGLQVSLIVQRVVRTVHEHGFLARVPMDVYETGNRVRLASMTHYLRAQLLYRVDSGVEFRIGGQKLPIQVVTRQRCTVVAGDDAVRIGHGYHFEDDALAKIYGLLAVPRDKFEEALHDEARVGLAWMDTSCHNYVLFVLVQRQFALSLVKFIRVYFQRRAGRPTG